MNVIFSEKLKEYMQKKGERDIVLYVGKCGT